MITGDNIYTAINVGYSSGILESDDNLWICKLVNNKIQWEYSSWDKRIQQEEISENNFKSIVSSQSKYSSKILLKAD